MGVDARLFLRAPKLIFLHRCFGADAVISVGHTLNKAVNETADMLYGFYIEVVKPAQMRKGN